MKKIVLAAVLSTMAVAASAQVYVAGHVGKSKVDANCSDMVSCDKEGTGYKLTLGYKLNPMAALEASYVDLGKVKGKASDSGFLIDGDLKTDGYLLAAAFRHHATPSVSLVGRLGLAVLNSKLTGRIGRVSASQDYNTTQPYVGLGAEYALVQQLRLTAGADFTRVKVDGATGSVRLFSIGAQYDF